jgi:cytochrome oxidase assembly protein ShyY1
VYRFLATPRWIAYAGLTLLLAATMVVLGLWQLSRYHQRSGTNARIDAATTARPVPVGQVLPVGVPPPGSVAWARVTATGRYDPAHQILARGRTVGGAVGFEVLVPLRLADGTALLVDRGWLPAPMGDARSVPAVPPAPTEQVRVTGRVHLPESHADGMVRVGGVPEVQRISPVRLATDLPYPLYGGYLLLDAQQPATAGFTAIPSDRENSLLNAGYVAQWWVFAGMTLGGFGWVARREARGPADRFDVARLNDEIPDAPVSPAV